MVSNNEIEYELIAIDLDNKTNFKLNLFLNQNLSQTFVYLKEIVGIFLAEKEGYVIDNGKNDIELYVNGTLINEDTHLNDTSILEDKIFYFNRTKQKHKYIYIHYIGISKTLVYKVNEDENIYSLLLKASKDINKEPKYMKFIFAGKTIDTSLKFKDCDFFTSSDKPYGAILID